MIMTIDNAHKDDLPRYVEDNIKLINCRISDFKLTSEGLYDETDIKNYLKSKLYDEFEGKKVQLLEKMTEKKYQKSKIEDIANEMIYYKPHLEKLFEDMLFQQLKDSCNNDMCKSVLKKILEGSTLNVKQQKFIEKSFKKILNKALLIAMQNGFSINVCNVESGVMTANAGDSAQFLFVSRAILAGYNCSNVDVRSSRYDAIVDYNGTLLKVQVKGITGNTVSFKDRDRGGRGIDTSNERNQGKRITSEDCDIYVAVDKQVGMCYIIPMKDIDPWEDDKIKSVNIAELVKYREKWSVIDKFVEESEDSAIPLE